MPGLLILTTLLRKLIRFIISIFLLSNPLMAADLPGLKSSDSPFAIQNNQVCCGKECMGSHEKLSIGL